MRRPAQADQDPPPWPSQADQGPQTPERRKFQGEVMAIWHLGEGRHEEKLRTAAPGSWKWVPGVLDAPNPSYSHSPFPEGYTRRSQCRARPSSRFWGELSLPAEGKKGDKQHREGGRERAQKAETPVQRPRGRSHVQAVRCWESARPLPVQRQRLEAGRLAV